MKNILTLLLVLTFPQFVSAIEIPGSSALADLIVGQFDNNADGTLDFGEWQSGMESGFAEIDNDGNGSVTAEELRELSGPLGDEIGEIAAQLVTPLIEKIVLTFDIDECGSVDRTEYDEKTDALLKLADADENTEITREELIAMPSSLIFGK